MFGQMHKWLRFGCSLGSLPSPYPKMKQRARAAVLEWKEERGAAAATAVVSKVFRTTAKIGGFITAVDDADDHHPLSALV